MAKELKVADRWSAIKSALLKDANVKANPELLKTWQEQFKIFDQGLTKKAKAYEADFKKMASGKMPKPKDIQDLKKNILELRGLVIQYQKQVDLIKKGYLKKFPMSISAFKYVEKQLDVIKADVDNALNAVG